MGAISEFLEDFGRDRDWYAAIEKEVETLCKEKLKNQKVNFTWQSRVKEVGSLQKKLEARVHNYETETDNVADLKDLVAGRVILTRWKDFGLVENVIHENFEIRGRSQHPKVAQNQVTLHERFRGYDGLHFHVVRRDSEDERYSNLVVEIQVISAFMWAWSSLEHDIVYKQLNGESDKNLLLNLEMLKGIANLGAVVVQQYEELLDSDPKSPFFERRDANRDLQFRIADFAWANKDIMSKNQEQNKRIVSWISEVNVEKDHNQVRSTLGLRYRKSGQWLLPRYEVWNESSEKRVFWLAGSVGTGKSSLISNVIEWHFEQIQFKDEEHLVFFYCSGKESAKTTALEVLRSLIAQLGQFIDSSISPLIRNEYEKRKNSFFEKEECPNLLEGLAKGYQRITVIIDALDECQDPDALLLNLRDVLRRVHASGRDMRLFFSGRYQVNVCDIFPDCDVLNLEHVEHLRKNDMKTFVQEEVKEREKFLVGSRLLKGRNPDLEERLIKVLVRNAQGMFMWTKLQLQLFFGPNARMRHAKDVIKKLDMLEKLDGSLKDDMLWKAYDSVYDDITEEYSASRVFAVRALKWMICAQQSLSIEELAEAASVGDDGTKDDVDADDILLFCSNFIVSNSQGMAQFPHVSVREYLTRRENNNIKEYSPEQAHTQVATTCLAYLSHPQTSVMDMKRWNDDKEGPEDNRLSEDIKSTSYDWRSSGSYSYMDQIQSRFFEYSIECWIAHVAAILPQNRSETLQRLYTQWLLENDGKCLMVDWLKIVPVFASDAVSEPPNPLFAACVWGLTDMIPESATTDDLNRLNQFDTPGLTLASQYGHFQVVKLLLDKGVDVNTPIKHDMYSTALQAAVWNDHETIVQLLLDRGANVDDCASQEAFVQSRISYVQLPLDHGASVRARGERSGTPLRAACLGGNLNIIQLLLDRGAKIDAQRGGHGSPLQAACLSRSDEKTLSIIRLLLDRGANINVQGEIYGSPLQAVCASRHDGKTLPIVQLLIDRGAMIDAQGGRYESPLQAACASYHDGKTLPIIQLLLDKGVNINAQGGRYGNALQVACASYGSKEPLTIVELLLDRGANINAQGGRFGNALQAACASYASEESSTIVELLLDRGANINAQGGRFGNALQAASFSGNSKSSTIVKLLLDKGANINAQGGSCWTALEAARIMRKWEIVNFLLERGAVDTQNDGEGEEDEYAIYENGEDEDDEMGEDEGDNASEDEEAEVTIRHQCRFSRKADFLQLFRGGRGGRKRRKQKVRSREILGFREIEYSEELEL